MTRPNHDVMPAGPILDQQMAWSRRYDPRPWGVWPWLGPLLTTVVLIGVLLGIAEAIGPGSGTPRTYAGLAISVVAESAVLFVAVMVVRPIAARAGGWAATFGVDRVRRFDWLPWLAGIGMTLVGRFVVGIVVVAATHGSATKQVQNVHFHSSAVPAIAGLVILTVIVAPVAEEFVFRGVVLRTFMRRMSFWPAACLSTAIFALIHVYEVKTVSAAITLAAGVGVLGLANCLLVRRTGRLAAPVMVHACFNLLATVVLIHRA